VTLTIHTEEDSQRQVLLTIEVAEERVQKALQQKVRTLSREVHIPGFRKGKVPPQVLIRRIGGEALRAEVVEELLPKVLEEALTQANLEPYAMPKVEDLELEPLVLKLTVPLRPEVMLGDYRSLRKEIPPVEVTDEAVDEVLEQIRQRHTLTEVVDRPVAVGDLVRLTINGRTVTADGKEEPFVEDQTANVIIDPEKLMPGTPFAENIVGMSDGEAKEFRFTFPEDYEDEDVAGREAIFDVKVIEVNSREVPEIDDELAKIDGGHETLVELRQWVSDRLQKEAEARAESDLVEAMIDDLVADAQILYPPAAVDRELDGRIDKLKRRVTDGGWSWEQYLESRAQSEEEMREQSRVESEEQVRRALVFAEFVRQEKLAISPEDVEEALSLRLAEFEEENLRNHLRELYTSDEGMQALSGDIIMSKVKDRVQAILGGRAPDLDALESAASDEEE
jgi:trigger factor